MHPDRPSGTRPTRRRVPPGAFPLLLAIAAGMAMARPTSARAAVFELSGSGRFRPPAAELLARLPADLPFTRADLESGRWSFQARYDDAVPDGDPDPRVGRYVGAVQALRLVIGATTLELPAAQAALVVSDGADVASRESVRLQAQAVLPAGVLRFAWMQANQQARTADLRGPASALPGDALPPAARLAELAVAHAADRYLELRLDAPGAGAAPLLYLSTSQPAVASAPAATP